MHELSKSQLKPWVVERVGNRLGITCPHCGGKALVNRRKWYNSRPGFIGRSCTYCFKTARITKPQRKDTT